MSAWLRISAEARKRSWLVVFAVAALLRLAFLGSIPGGLNQDEASTGYDAWALLTAGVDRNGFSWPVQFISWGSGQNALYAWLSMPFLATFGLSVFALRLAMALAGVATLALFFRMGTRFGGERAGMCALFILAVNPWHIMASRWGLESNILPFVVLCSVTCLAESTLPSCKWPRALLGVSGAVAGLSVYAYGPAYLFTPLFFGAALLAVRARANVPWNRLVLAFALTSLVALPMLVFVLNNRFGTRSLALGPVSVPHYPGPARFDSIFLPFSSSGRARLWRNIGLCLRLVLTSSDDGLAWNGIRGFGPLFNISLPFLVWGIFGVFRRPSRTSDLLMFTWFVIALLVGMMTDANINRINLVWLPAIWLVARGLEELAGFSLLFRSSLIAYAAMAVWFSYVYFGAWNEKISRAFSEGFGPALKATIARAGKTDTIVVTNRMNMPYISTLFFSETPVREYIDTATIADRAVPFQQVSAFGRFVFGVNPEALSHDRFYVVHRSEASLFDPKLYGSRSFGSFESVWRLREQTKKEK